MAEQADSPATWALDVCGISAGYDGHEALDGVTFRIEPGCLAGLVGPNGAGKSTLIKVILGMLKPWSGEVSVFGREGRPRAGLISYTPQVDLVDWDFPVTLSDVVLMGRYGRLGVVRRPGARDREIAASALERVRLTEMAGRQIGELSGGERRRVLIARALTQQGELMLLDEPFAGLDAAAQHDLISLFQSLVAEGKTLFIATHDLSCVDEDFDHAVLLNKHVIAFGRPADVFTPESLNEAYERHLMVLRSEHSTYIGI